MSSIRKGSCHCGIYTHHQRRSNPGEYGFNIACLEGVQTSDYEPAPMGDGRSMSLVEELLPGRPAPDPAVD